MAQAVALLCLHPHRVISAPSRRNLECRPLSNLGSFPCRKSSIFWKIHPAFNGRTSGRVIINSHQTNRYGEADPSRPRGSNLSKQLTKFASQNFLPIALVTGVAFGLANPDLGRLAHSYNLSKISTFGIFVISGLTLRSDEIGAATQAWPVVLFGLASILFISPLSSKIIMLLRLQPLEFVTGLALFSCMPTTLSSGVAITRLAGGNSALALAMTVISNLLGILIVPFSISTLIAGGLGVSFPTESLLRSLIVTLLVPLILGKVAREGFPALAAIVDANRNPLAIISAILLSFVPWIQISRSRSLILSVKPTTFLVAVFMGGFLHALLLCFNYFAIPTLSLISGGSKSPFAKEENTSALVLVASQKTLPVMIAVVEQLGSHLGEPGLLILPCIAAHLNQIIIDSFLVSLWKRPEGDGRQQGSSTTLSS